MVPMIEHVCFNKGPDLGPLIEHVYFNRGDLSIFYQ